MDTKTLYSIHGTIMGFALLVVFPIGLIMSIGRVSKDWYIYHKYSMGITTFLLFCGILLSLYTKDTESETSLTTLSAIHGSLGVFLVIMLLTQLWWAVVMRRFLGKEKRSFWEKGHIVIAITVIILVVCQLYLGLKVINYE